MELGRLVIGSLLLGGTEIERSGVKQAGSEMIVVSDGADEILAGQLTVERNQGGVRSVDSLNFLPVVVNFPEVITIAGLRNADPQMRFDQQMRAWNEPPSDRLL